MFNFWKGKKVLLTGGTGFIGSNLARLLLKKGADVTITTFRGNLKNILSLKKDLRIVKTDLSNFTNAVSVTKNKEIVLNLAAHVAGIQYNLKHSGTMLKDNLEITENMLEAARINHVERLLLMSSVCVYSEDCTTPIEEEYGFVGQPEKTNFGYGWAKRVTEIMAKTYSDQFGMKIAVVRPTNVYGPNDKFDPRISHVIPSLIRRVFNNESPLRVWGSGKQIRSFIFVEDLTEGLLKAVEKYFFAEPINLASDEKITIANLAKMIVKLSGKKTKVLFDKSKPDGHPRRIISTKKAKEKIGFIARTPLNFGLQKTIEWYKENYD